MARAIKEGIEYYPHYVVSGKTIFTLESLYGNDGYAFWFKLLEVLGNQFDLCYNCSKRPDWLYLVAKTKVTEDIAEKIINTLVELDAIDGELWMQNKVIWIQKFTDNFVDVYKKRKQPLPKRPCLRDESDDIPEISAAESTAECENFEISAAESTAECENFEISVAESTQRKVKESKVKESKVNTATAVNIRARDSGGENVFAVFEQCGFQINGYTSQELQALCEEYSEPWAIEAIKRAADQGKRTLAYVKGILSRWQTVGAIDAKARGKPARPSFRDLLGTLSIL